MQTTIQTHALVKQYIKNSQKHGAGNWDVSATRLARFLEKKERSLMEQMNVIDAKWSEIRKILIDNFYYYDEPIFLNYVEINDLGEVDYWTFEGMGGDTATFSVIGDQIIEINIDNV
jgi:hypothetical protein